MARRPYPGKRLLPCRNALGAHLQPPGRLRRSAALGKTGVSAIFNGGVNVMTSPKRSSSLTSRGGASFAWRSQHIPLPSKPGMHFSKRAGDGTEFAGGEGADPLFYREGVSFSRSDGNSPKIAPGNSSSAPPSAASPRAARATKSGADYETGEYIAEGMRGWRNYCNSRPLIDLGDVTFGKNGWDSRLVDCPG